MMKKTVSVLGILSLAAFMAACGPDMKVINEATQKAQTDQTRAASAAQSAEQSAAAAQAAAQKAQGESEQAQDSVRRANDAVARLEAAFAGSVTK